MDLSAEVPTHFRSSAARPGPLGSLREAVVEVLGRRRLIGYLVQADLHKKGADTLHKHAIDGFQGSAGLMPPKGGATNLSDKSIMNAVDYMIGQVKK